MKIGQTEIEARTPPGNDSPLRAWDNDLPSTVE